MSCLTPRHRWPNVSSSPQQKPTGGGPSSPGPWQRWSGVATALGTVIALVGVLVAVLAWLRPQSPAGSRTPASPTWVSPNEVSPIGGTAPPTATTPLPADAGPVFLDNGDFSPVAGGDNVVELPRGVTASHAIAVTCPTNQSSDQASDVTFPLHGRYYQFDATVRPYYPKGADQQSVTHVTASTGTRQRDGTLTVAEVGSQKRATTAAPATLTAIVDNAETLTVRVECQDPDGTVLLTDARLTP